MISPFTPERERNLHSDSSAKFDPDTIVMDRIRWGQPDILFTPAYWADQLDRHPELNSAGVHRLGDSLLEESVACLLGGYGIPAEVGLAAFSTLKSAGLIKKQVVSDSDILAVLEEPLSLGNRLIRYRFARQKSRYIAGLLSHFEEPEQSDHQKIRDWLLRFDGIGLKTASWIIRNWFHSDHVAIIDIHIQRAGHLAGFFKRSHVVSRDYHEMETRFLDFALAIGAKPSALDALMWLQMRQAQRLASRIINV